MTFNLKEGLEQKCLSPEGPCSISFRISQKLNSFEEVIKIFRKHGFNIEEFVDDYMCIMTREKEGFNEAIKVDMNKIEIKALKDTLFNMCDDLQEYCLDIE